MRRLVIGGAAFLSLAALGYLLLGVGWYLFPAGSDLFLFSLEDAFGRALGTFYGYLICIAMIVGGMLILRPGWFLRFFSNPFIGGLGILAILAFVAVLGTRVIG